jgi:hypothetical protein
LPLPFARIIHEIQLAPSKNPANSHVKPLAHKNRHSKIDKQFEMNSLQAKNKSAKTGILVSLNSIELKVDRKKKTKARPKAGPSLLTSQPATS